MARIIFATCFSGSGETYRRVALPHIERVATAEDLILARSGDADGIGAVYNAFLSTARATSCDALVLIQDDVEIHDPAFREKIHAAVAKETVGIVGAVGARHVTGLEWWTGSGVGQVYETRGPIAFTERSGPVDAVDGLLLALSPTAIERLAFDEERFPRFHGYGVDVCFSARQLGLGVEVVPLRLLHRTQGGYKDSRDFDDAKRRFAAKHCGVFPQVVPPPPPHPLAQVLGARAFGVARTGVRAAFAVRDRAVAAVARTVSSARTIRARLRRADAPRPVVIADPHAVPRCLGCDLVLPLPASDRALPLLLDCAACGSSITWPPPNRDIASDRIWRDQYRGLRLEKREQWLREAAIRLDWIVSESPEAPRSGRCRMLDVGAATGEFVEVARERGYVAEGVEPSSWAVAVAREHGVALFEGSLADWSSDAGRTVDVVTLWHVLEHVEDPSALLDEIRALLVPDGRVVVEVPNRQGSESQRLGPAWHGTQLEEHVVHFSPTGITRLFERNAFTITSLETCSDETYATEERWLRRTNKALLQGIEWPSLDLIRVIATPATVTSTATTSSTAAHEDRG